MPEEAPPRPVLVVVSGMPGAGKTTLARAIGEALHLPVLTRDLVKTGLHVTARSAEPADVHRFAEPAWDAFYAAVGGLLERGVSVVAEAAFHRDWSGPPLAALGAAADTAHVAVRVDPAVAVDRYRRRAERGERHAAHADDVMAEQLLGNVDRYLLAEPRPLLLVDTTDGTDPSVEEIIAFVDSSRSA